MRAAISSILSTPSAISMRRMLANRLIASRHASTLGIFKEQRRAAGFYGAIGKLGDLEIRIDLERNAVQFSLFFERTKETAQIVKWHEMSLHPLS